MLALTSFLALGAAVNEHGRQLSNQQILRYSPTTTVTDHANIDLDQAALESLMSDSFPMADSQAMYESGAHSKPTATCTLSSPLAADVASKEAISFTDNAGSATSGKAKSSFSAGATEIQIMYPVGDQNPQTTACYVGSLATADQMTNGCLDPSQNITIGGSSYTCTSVANAGGRTLKGFSTASKSKMYDATLSSKDCPAPTEDRGYVYGCPYKSYVPFYDYYCSDTTSSCYASGDYGNQIVLSGYGGTATGLKGTGVATFNMDFSTGTANEATFRKDVIKKATAYMNAWMYTIREFEDAIDDCTTGDYSNAASYDPVHAWDEGVAFYTGSLMKPEYLYGDDASLIDKQGKLAYTLANKRCKNFKTCGENSGETSGEAKVNHDLFKLFREGQEDILTANCAAIVPVKDKIVETMSIPLIQGSLRYAYYCDKSAICSAKAAGEAAIFAASILPYVHKCSATHAATIAEAMNPSSFTCSSSVACQSTKTSFNDVKAAFEACYESMGILCSDVGGLWDDSTKKYYVDANRDATPCMDKFPPPPPPPPVPASPAAVVETIPAWGIALICVLGGLFVVVCLGFAYLIAMEKNGRPVFLSLNNGAAKAQA